MNQVHEQVEQPFAEAISETHQSVRCPFTTPGHKRWTGIPDLGRLTDALHLDPPLLCGVDNRRMSLGVREKAEQLAAEAYKADRAFFQQTAARSACRQPYSR